MASHRSLCGHLKSAPEPQPGAYKTFTAWNNAHDAWVSAWSKACREHDERGCLKRQRDEAMAQRQTRQPQPPIRSIADLFE